MQGKVYLIGMGPGDPELITLKAIEAIRKCDVLIYDRLINRELLKYNPSAECVYVGKSSGNHTLGQDVINELLLEKAREGHIVGRLKGGDPLVFGRGGEEAVFLNEHGVESEIIPGITSALAVPMYAGIPVTFRGMATSFHVITGHEHSGISNIDWSALAKLKGTLIFLMGMENIARIVDNLIANGKNSDCPAAVIMNGTRYNQKEVYGTLSDIAEKCAARGMKSPSIIIVGETVNLNEYLRSCNDKSLSGMRVILTGSADRADTLCEILESVGARVNNLPCIAIKGLEDASISEEALKNYDAIVFSSSHGVLHFMDSLSKSRVDIRCIRGALFGVGPSVRKELEKYNIYNCNIPQNYNGNSLVDLIKSLAGEEDRILVVSGNLGGEVLLEGLKEYKVDRMIVYETSEGCEDTVEEADAIVFTSPSCVRGFLSRHSVEDYCDILVVCIGDKTLEQANKAGFRNTRVLENAVPELLVDTLANWRSCNA